MYESPIDLLMSNIQTQIIEQQEEAIYKAVFDIGVNVTKDELLRALAYDRQQYEIGFAEGIAAAKPEWIPVTERLPEKDVLVLCIGARGGMFIGYPRWVYEDEKVAYTRVPNSRHGRQTKYWMPLPEPPKEVP